MVQSLCGTYPKARQHGQETGVHSIGGVEDSWSMQASKPKRMGGGVVSGDGLWRDTGKIRRGVAPQVLHHRFNRDFKTAGDDVEKNLCGGVIDLSMCFDRVSPHLAIRVLELLGLP